MKLKVKIAGGGRAILNELMVTSPKRCASSLILLLAVSAAKDIKSVPPVCVSVSALTAEIS